MGASSAELSPVIETRVRGRDPAEREGGSLRGQGKGPVRVQGPEDGSKA